MQEQGAEFAREVARLQAEVERQLRLARQAAADSENCSRDSGSDT